MPALSDAISQVTENINSPEPTSTVASAYQPQAGSDTKSDSGDGLGIESKPSPESQHQTIDLDKYDKPFRFDGKEWTAKDLKEAYLRQADYTKKTQEIAQERSKLGEISKYWNNLDLDLESVRRDPSLSRQFMQVYPKYFHKYLGLTQNQVIEEKREEPQGHQMDQSVMDKMSKFEEFISRFEQRDHETKVKEAGQFIDEMISKFSVKYDMADKDVVLVKADSALNAIIDDLKRRESMGEEINWEKQASLTESQWERLFKFVHDGSQKIIEQKQKAVFNKQKEANAKGKDIASGGGIPGQAPEKVPLKKVKDMIMRDMEKGMPH